MNCHIVGLHVKFERLRGSYSYVFWFSVFFDNSNDQLCVLSACVCGFIVSASLCQCLHLCKSQCWYMFINNRKGVCVCLRVCAFVCVYELSEKEEWFHLDLIHLGGNLLVNRLVHELRRVDLRLLVCNIACGQFRFFSFARKYTD